MSIHGIQKFFPFAIDKSRKIIDSPADYAIAFKYFSDLKKDGEEFINFSRLAWPLILVQGGPTSHIIFDDVGICKLDIKVTNAPPQAAIGHILRNIENRTYNEMLDKIKAVIEFTEEGMDIQNEEIEEKEDIEKVEEFQSINIPGLMNPGLLEGISQLFKASLEIDIVEYALLESVFSVDRCLNLTQKYKNYIILTRGNVERWETLKGLIDGPFNEWTTELRVKIKDTEMRYKSTINKEEKVISPDDVNEKLNEEKDILDRWNLSQKKGILEKIGGLFLPIDQILEELRNKNRPLLQTDSFKTLNVDNALELAKSQIKNIEESREKLKDKLGVLKSNFTEYMKKLEEIDLETEDKLKMKSVELKTQLAQRNSRIQSVSEASLSYIDQLKDVEQLLDDKLKEIHEIIEQKKRDCLNDVKKLENWGINDKITELATPVIRYFMPVYVALFEDEEEDEERLAFLFPKVLSENLTIDSLSEGFNNFLNDVEEIVEEDMKIRSNFEFTIDKLNLLEKEDTLKKIQDGFKILESNNLISNAISEKYISLFKNLKE